VDDGGLSKIPAGHRIPNKKKLLERTWKLLGFFWCFGDAKKAFGVQKKLTTLRGNATSFFAMGTYIYQFTEVQGI